MEARVQNEKQSKPTQHYKKEFKLRVLEAAGERRLPGEEICRQYGIHKSVYYRWLNRYREMTKRAKLVDKIKNAKTADFDEIDLLLTQLGFKRRNRGTSHYTYTKPPICYRHCKARPAGKEGLPGER